MKSNIICVALLLCLPGVQATGKAKMQGTGAPLAFVENIGQVHDQHGDIRTDIDYRLPAAPGLNVYVSAGQLHYQFSKPLAGQKYKPQHAKLLPGKLRKGAFPDTGINYEMYRLDMTLDGANPHAEATTDAAQQYYENYYVPGVCRDDATAHTWGSITYHDVYPGIDWHLYLKNGALEYDFIVHPGANPHDIKIKYGGATNLAIAAAHIVVQTPLGSIAENSLYCYEQETGQPVAASFVPAGAAMGFAVGRYKGTVVIDPRLEWATYYGGSGINGESETESYGIATDTAGNVYLTGATASITNIATIDAYMDTITHPAYFYDAFIVKFNEIGGIVWGTYYGGDSGNFATSIAIDNQNNIYITGQTSSRNGIATVGAYRTYFGWPGAVFLTKFTENGGLVWGTYFGGNDIDGDVFVTCDKAGNAYITGQTESTDSIASPGSYHPTFIDTIDAYLAKFSSSGNLEWATYFGGSGVTRSFAVCTDTNNNVYITGATSCDSGIVTPGAYQTTNIGGYGIYIASFTDSGNIRWATYYGGGGQPSAMASDNLGNIYVTGFSSTPGIATPSAYKTSVSNTTGNTFLFKFSDSGLLSWGTYYGGNEGSEGCGISINTNGNICVAGSTKSTDSIATEGAWESTYSATDGAAFVAVFSVNDSLIWGTYFEGDSIIYSGEEIACDKYGNAYLTGCTSSPHGIATSNAFDTTYYGVFDGYRVGAQGVAFLAKFDTLETNGVKFIQDNSFSFNLFPNPAHEELNVSWDNNATSNLSDDVQIKITGMDGFQLLAATVPARYGKTQVALNGLPDGLYLCRMEYEQAVVVKKFMVLK